MSIAGINNTASMGGSTLLTTTEQHLTNAVAYTFVAAANEEFFRVGAWIANTGTVEVGLHNITTATEGAPLIGSANLTGTGTGAFITADFTPIALTSGNTYAVSFRAVSDTSLMRVFSSGAANRHATLTGTSALTTWAAGTTQNQLYGVYAESQIAAGDVTNPTITNAVINAAGDTLTLTTSEAVDVTDGSGFALSAAGATLADTSGAATTSLAFSIGRVILASETPTLDYVTVTDGIEDAAGNDLLSFSEYAITNDSTQTASGSFKVSNPLPTVFTGRAQQPRPDGEATNGFFRFDHSQMDYEVEVLVEGLSWPFKYEIITAPAGATIGAELTRTVEGDKVLHTVPADYGVLKCSAANMGTGVKSFLVRVTDQFDVTLDVAWTSTRNDAKFVFINSATGSNANAGTHDLPLQTFVPLFEDNTYAGRRAVFMGNGTYLAGNGTAGKHDIVLNGATRPSALMAYPGDAPVIDMSNAEFVDSGGSAEDLAVIGLIFDGDRGDVNNTHIFDISGNTNRHTFSDLRFRNVSVGLTGASNPACIAHFDLGTHRENIVVTRCVAESTVDVQLYTSYAARHVYVENNVGLNQTTPSSNGAHFIYIKDDTEFLTLRNNFCEGAYAGSPLAVGNQNAIGCDNQDVSHNTIIVTHPNAGARALHYNVADNSPGANNASVRRNTVICTGIGEGLQMDDGPGKDPVALVGNLIVADTPIDGTNYTVGTPNNAVLTTADFNADGKLNNVNGARTAHLGLRGAELASTGGAGADTTAPTITSASVATNGTTLTLTASEAIDVGAGGNGGFAITGKTVTYASGAGSTSIVLTVSLPIVAGTTPTLAYTQPGDGWQDLATTPNDLATFSGLAITNNSTQVTNTPATGQPVIDGLVLGTPVAGLILRADDSGIADSDGIPIVGDNAPISHQWYLNGTVVTGAINKVFKPHVTDDVGKTVRLDSSFIDSNGTLETIQSAVTPAVAANTNAGKLLNTQSIKPFVYYSGAGGNITANDVPILAKYEHVFLDRFRDDDVNGATWNEVKALSPNTKFYLYQQGSRTLTNQDAFGLKFATTVNRWADARGAVEGNIGTDNTDWILLNDNGDQILFSENYPEEKGLDFGNTDVQDFVIKYTLNDIADQIWCADGIYFDNMINLDPPVEADDARRPAIYGTPTLWNNAMNSLNVAVSQALHARGLLVGANRGVSRTAEGSASWGALNAAADQPDVMLEEGAFSTNFGTSDTLFWIGTNWKNQVDVAQTCDNSSTVYMSHTDLVPGQTGTMQGGAPVTYDQSFRYAVASYLIAQRRTGPKTYFCWNDNKDVEKYGQLRDPDFLFKRFDIGQPTAEYQAVPNSALYFRQYDRGVVYVNPSAADETGVTRVENANTIDVPAFDAVMESAAVYENLIPHSEDYAQWTVRTNVTLSADAGNEPEGVGTTTILHENTTTGGLHFIRKEFTNAQMLPYENQVVTLSAYVEPLNRAWVYIVFQPLNGQARHVNFNVTTGATGFTHADILSSRINDVGGGVYRCEITFNMGSGAFATPRATIYVAEADNDVTFDGLDQDSLRVSGVQLNRGNQAATYLPTPLVNTVATGIPEIIGSGAIGDELRAGLGTISDEDGIDLATITQEWRRDGTPIATGATYTPVAADEDADITVATSFTDLKGFSEGPLTSNARTVSSDINNASLTASLPVAATAIATAVADDNNVAISADLPVTVAAITTELQDIDAENLQPTGGVYLAEAGAVVGATVIADTRITNANGVNNLRFEWFRDDVKIDSQTTENYKFVAADSGTTVSVVAKYEDDDEQLIIVQGPSVLVS